MRESLQRTCERFVSNQETLKKCLFAGDLRIRSVCAAMLLRASYVNEEVLKEAEQALKDEVGVFSNFRGYAKMPSITMLALSGHPQTHIEESQETYRLLKEYFSGSTYLALAALNLTSLVPDWQREEVASRGRTLYKRMKKEHHLLTSREDAPFALLMALSPRTDDELIETMEADYDHLRRTFSAGDSLQSLSHVLTIQNADWEKAEELYLALKENGLKYSRGYELSMLGVLAGRPAPVDQLVQEMREIYDFLDDKKGYGIWGLSKKTRLMHAAMLLGTEECQQEEADAVTMDTALLSGTIAMIAAEQAALAAIIAADTAAASTAH